MSFKSVIKDSFFRYKIDITEEQLEKLCCYGDFLRKQNQVMNLTALVSDEDIALKHFTDSAVLLQSTNILRGCSMLDIGTGAGFPGMVCKILRPDLRIVLLDSLEKRCNFLTELCKRLDIGDVEVLWGRAEDYGRKKNYRESFDFATARAVSEIPVLLEYGMPFLKTGGTFLIMKGEKEHTIDDSVLSELSGEVAFCREYALEGDFRRIFGVQKIAPIQEKYPRRVGVPKKKPLGLKK